MRRPHEYSQFTGSHTDLSTVFVDVRIGGVFECMAAETGFVIVLTRSFWDGRKNRQAAANSKRIRSPV